MFPFTEFGPFDRTERKALLVAFFFCAVFIGLLSVSAPEKRARKKPLTIVDTPLPTAQYEPPPPFTPPLEKFRLQPEIFWNFDFMNFSYGKYVSSDGKSQALNIQRGLLNGEKEWFEVKDVFYKDLTGDGVAEAIVRLSHVKCDGDWCDGSDLFYIYTLRNGKLTNLWRYETGTYAYGCGLKSLMLGDKQVVVELFGRCSSQAMVSPGPAKFLVEDATLTIFEFNGRRFMTKSARYFIEPMRNVQHWEPVILIE